MKKKYTTFIIIGIFLLCTLNWIGIGYHYSGAAAYDLAEELEAVYGEEYTGKEVADGLEDMVFQIEPKTFFMTNWNLRRFFSKPYRYECTVTYTTYVKENTTKIRTITYQAVDPMGYENENVGAHLIRESKVENTINK